MTYECAHAITSCERTTATQIILLSLLLVFSMKVCWISVSKLMDDALNTMFLYRTALTEVLAVNTALT